MQSQNITTALHWWWIGMSTVLLSKEFVLACKDQQDFLSDFWFPLRGLKRLSTKKVTNSTLMVSIQEQKEQS